MVTQDRAQQTIIGGFTTNATYFGLSTDSKPSVGVGNGSCFLEMDTGKIYFYDADGSQWLEWGA